jgi:hypothetical protein
MEINKSSNLVYLKKIVVVEHPRRRTSSATANNSTGTQGRGGDIS